MKIVRLHGMMICSAYFNSALSVSVFAASVFFFSTEAVAQAQDTGSQGTSTKIASGPIILHGGGYLHPLIVRKFVDAAGGGKAKIVVVTPGAKPSAEAVELIRRIKETHKPISVSTYHAASVKQSNDLGLIKPVLAATGIWFADARLDDAQKYEMKAYLPSRFERALYAAQQRGAVIGGRGKGAVVLTRVMGQFDGNTVRLKGGFDALKDCVIVDALLRDNQWERLLYAVRRYPSLLGFGIDTETAMVIHGDSLVVMGESYVHAARWDRATKGPAILSLHRRNGVLSLASLRQWRLKKERDVEALIESGKTRAKRSKVFGDQSDIIKQMDGESSDSTGATKGAIVIHGGGAMPKIIWNTFIRLGGSDPDGTKGRLINIPTANMDLPASTKAVVEAGEGNGFSKVTTLHTRKQKVADTQAFCEPLGEATALWFGRGRQRLLADAYRGTRFERELMALYDRGCVIGGSAGGASALSRVMIIGSHFDNNKIKARFQEGFDLLPNAIIDQQFMVRNRWARLLNAVRTHPDLLGVGIDESAAAVYRNGKLAVIGESYVHAVRWEKGEAYPQILSLRAGSLPVDYKLLLAGKLKRAGRAK